MAPNIVELFYRITFYVKQTILFTHWCREYVDVGLDYFETRFSEFVS